MAFIRLPIYRLSTNNALTLDQPVYVLEAIVPKKATVAEMKSHSVAAK
jgi:hypothetical protein